MKVAIGTLLGVVGCICFFSGCSQGGSKVAIVPAKGTVTFHGGPVAGANVTFMPDKGPLAMAITDLNGEFKLNTGSYNGCAVGPAKVAIWIAGAEEEGAPAFDPNEAPKTAEDFAEMSKKMADATKQSQKKNAGKQKSLIPSKYKDVKTSNLTYTIDNDKSKNDFQIELKD